MSGHNAESECVCTCGFKGLYPAILRQHLADPAAWPATGGMWRDPDGVWRQREAARP